MQVDLCFPQKATGAAGGAIPRRRNGKVFLGKTHHCLMKNKVQIEYNSYNDQFLDTVCDGIWKDNYIPPLFGS